MAGGRNAVFRGKDRQLNIAAVVHPGNILLFQITNHQTQCPECLQFRILINSVG